MLVVVSGCTPALGTGSAPTKGVTYPSTSMPANIVTPTQESTRPQPTAEIFNETYTPKPTFPEPTFTLTSQPTVPARPGVVFAAIGDYGSGNQDEGDVAKLIETWQPDFIITLGDNNYPEGAADNMDKAVGQFFHNYIFPYKGSYGEGADKNRFFPSLGNHDLITENGKPYYDYFTLPGNERYYDFTWDSLHFFVLNTNDSEPDGVGASSTQAAWLKDGLQASTATWNIVYMHYPPYSSGLHGSTDWARWPYAEWGADVVLSGHDHTYERLEEGGLEYFVNGLGGSGRYEFVDILPGSLVRFNSDYGAIKVEATESQIKFEFITRVGEVVDAYILSK